MDEPANNSLTGKACLTFALAVMAGAALAWAISPALFRALPADTSRIPILLDTMRDLTRTPKIILFGSSVGMAGIDTARITKQLPGQPLAYNLSSSGQALVEAYLYYQEVPDSVDIVIQMVSAKSLEREGAINEQKYNAVYMYGYRPNEQTQQVLRTVFPTDMGELLAKSDLQQRFDSRWVVRQMADRFARSIFRKDLTLDRSTNDLFFPSSYSRRLPEEQYRIALQNEFREITNGGYWPQESKLDLLQQIAADMNANGKELVLLAEPINPELAANHGERYLRGYGEMLREFAARNDVILLDGRRQVAEQDFVDAVHPTPEGAAKFSEWLADELLRLRDNGELNF
ncbi:MAG: hypothetical protein HKN56_01130 [Gammaproteobacteria bacterium]|nr:SGNH/GDSL hydrolase family protein [Gammaproteobacteria bacterium]NND53558.1 hypothetical protein [Gammaproteobacteria bacterium]